MSSKTASDTLTTILSDQISKEVGKGLRQQLDDHAIPYKPMKLDEMLENLMRMIFVEEFAKLDELLERGIISDNQNKTLTAMLCSSDQESVILGADLIQVIHEENGNQIHREEP